MLLPGEYTYLLVVINPSRDQAWVDSRNKEINRQMIKQRKNIDRRKTTMQKYLKLNEISKKTLKRQESRQGLKHEDRHIAL